MVERDPQNRAVPDPRSQDTTRAVYTPPFFFAFCVEQKPGEGEDADPLVSISSLWDHGLIGVFDGMGGAGSAVHMYRGVKHTGAYIASRLAREVVETFFKSPSIEPTFSRDTIAAQSVAQNLQVRLADAFKAEVAKQTQ